MDIAKSLKHYRKLNKMTQQDVGDAIGKDRTSYTKYERGDANPPFDVLEKIADVFNIPYTALFSDDFESVKTDPSDILTVKSYDEQELLSIFRKMDDDTKKVFLENLKKDSLK